MLERVAGHLERGEVWRATRRLRCYLAQQPFDPRFAEALARIELARGERPAAAALFWVAGTAEAQAQAVVREWLEGPTGKPPDGEALWRSLPASLRRGLGDRPIPAHAVVVLRERGVAPDARLRAAQRHRDERSGADSSPWRQGCQSIGCTLGCALFALCMLLGAREVYRAVAGWLGW